MCGIGGWQIIGNECDSAQVARVLLRLLEVRGKDASGVAWHDSGATYVRKGACAGKELARVLDKVIGTTGIVHTRWATQGSPMNEKNNHPIDVGGLVGVHNGHINNDDELIAKCVDYKRQAQVDSEAVFAYMAHGNKDTTLVERLGEVRGNAALLWLRSYDKAERLYAVKLAGSPLWFGQTKKGSIVFASTLAILQETAKRCKLVFEYTYEMKQGEQITAQDGIVKHMEKVNVPLPAWKPLPDYSKHSWQTLTTGKGKKRKQAKADRLLTETLLGFGDAGVINDDYDYDKEQAEYEEMLDAMHDDAEAEINLREQLDKQFGMGRYGKRW